MGGVQPLFGKHWRKSRAFYNAKKSIIVEKKTVEKQLLFSSTSPIVGMILVNARKVRCFITFFLKGKPVINQVARHGNNTVKKLICFPGVMKRSTKKTTEMKNIGFFPFESDKMD